MDMEKFERIITRLRSEVEAVIEDDCATVIVDTESETVVVYATGQSARGLALMLRLEPGHGPDSTAN